MFAKVYKRSQILLGAAAFVILLGFVIVAKLTVDQVYNTFQNKSESHTVIIDPGHGGEDGGAIGVDGTVEKDINLAISLKLQSIFKTAGFQVVMIRSDDSAIYDKGSETLRTKKNSDLHNRLKIANSHPNSLFLSIHQNMYSDGKYSGAQVFYSKNNGNSKILAEILQLKIKNNLQPQNDRMIKPAGDNLFILYNAKIPAVMVECGFLSNSAECKMLADNQYQNQMAFTIFSGTMQYYSENAGN